MNDRDALLILSFGGPEGPDDVMPFLRNVVRGRGVPDERLREVADRYLEIGGTSPIVAQTRELVEAVRSAVPELPVYLGNRNWHPFLADTLERMASDGVERAVAFATSAYSSYSGCRQYLEDIEAARASVGERAPALQKIPPFCGHPGFVEANRARLLEALDEPGGAEPLVLFTAHSLPLAMARQCEYEAELERTAAAILGGVERDLRHRIVFQSRSGPPAVPWLEPDVLDALREAAKSGEDDVLLAPIGFLSDHMEVAYDLDVEARSLARELGLRSRRARTVGTHPRFIAMIRELALDPEIGSCATDCCPKPKRPAR